MAAMFAPVWAKVAAVIMSMVMTIGSMFGIFAPSTTVEPADYTDNNIKNVIYLIGDGMGPLHLEKTKQERGITLAMDTLTYQGKSMTRSLTSAVTDSAAGGTALATGVRTYNGAIGVYMTDKNNELSHPMNLTELAISMGKLAGVITTDSTAGATPADIKLFAENVGGGVEIKAAGGISSLADAEEFLALGATRLGTSRIVKLAKNEQGSGY